MALDPLDESAAASLARMLVECRRRDKAHETVAQAERNLRLAGLAPGPSLLQGRWPRRPR
ncbi:hypothetical protein [Erythrobacter cryptus]|uniref:hypothetical protein n=1 Tax=Erythrobacter cryptus TaxID=196588 RepID=UPI00040E9076|nr:hypothetical protein [Erythrobacter cryptus]